MAKARSWAKNPTNFLVNFEAAKSSRERQAERWLRKVEADRKREADRPKGKSVPGFYSTPEWLKLRYRALKKYGARCQCCGRTAKDGVTINVDHIKSRTKHPELALKLSNLQVLCAPCNHGKGWRDATDWRGN